MLQQLIKNPERLKDLVDEAKDVALLSGLVIRTKEMANSSEVNLTDFSIVCIQSMYTVYMYMTIMGPLSWREFTH